MKPFDFLVIYITHLFFTEIPGILWADTAVHNLSIDERAQRYLAISGSLIPQYLSKINDCITSMANMFNSTEDVGEGHAYNPLEFEKKIVKYVISSSYHSSMDVKSTREVFRRLFAELLAEGNIIITPHARRIIDPKERRGKKIADAIVAFKKALTVKMESTAASLRMVLRDSSHQISDEKMQMHKLREAFNKLAMENAKLQQENENLRKRMEKRPEHVEIVRPTVLPPPIGYRATPQISELHAEIPHQPPVLIVRNETNAPITAGTLQKSLNDYSTFEMMLDN